MYLLGNLAEMEPLDSKGYGQSETLGLSQQGPHKQPPIACPPPFPDAQHPHRPDQRSDIPRTNNPSSLVSWLILFKKYFDTFAVLLGRIDCTQDMLIAANKSFVAHFGNEIG